MSAPAGQAGPAPAAPASQPPPTPVAAPATGDATGIPPANASGDIGYRATQTGTATKTDTPLRNVPQSVSVITKQQIEDQKILSIQDAVKYVPGIIIHQGEGNRDQISIRGMVASTADFFVNGVRDDGQIFRDLYNSERVEVLKGPSAMIFGRGGAGGVVNRVTRQADFTTIREGTVEYGSFDHKRATIDVGQALNPLLAFRMTGVYENSGSYRDHVELERWGVNPTVTFKPSDSTRIKLGFEHFEDHRTADRGIPSYRPAGSVFGLPSPTGSSTFFGNPDVSFANGSVNSTFATIEHKTDFGVTIRNHSSWAAYEKMYQNVYSGGPLNLTTGLVPLVAYNNINNRENLFNQTDITHKAEHGGWFRNTLLTGFELGQQGSSNFRRNGSFSTSSGCSALGTGNSLPTGTCFAPFSSPTIFGQTVSFVTAQTRNQTEVSSRSVYVQDQMELTRYVEIIGGVRQEVFALDYTNLLPATAAAPAALSRTDHLTSPRAGIILKPLDTLSIYGSFAVSYLPASGDQFAAVAATTVNLKPEKYTNHEVGVKWDVTTALAFTGALYQLDRENARFAQANGTFIQTGKSQVEGYELTLTGYLTRDWQLSAGYGNQIGKLTSATSPVLVAGTPLPLLPHQTMSLWTRYQLDYHWGVGVGVVHQTEKIASLQPANNQVLLPSFTTVDAAVFYKLSDNLRAQLNVTNIFNQKYIVSADNNDNLTPGAPTAAILSITSKF